MTKLTVENTTELFSEKTSYDEFEHVSNHRQPCIQILCYFWFFAVMLDDDNEIL